jgi:hypothetical protein
VFLPAWAMKPSMTRLPELLEYARLHGPICATSA